ncbi:MAG: hypothetical protein S4CHLAM45_01090 [Chlamydiales bacterium]|nr:hypothetical protein [Chlamydiales bacterium]MCH9619430.1 hypothetical protein [Chlamydiales bacterium]MCH9622234.1 hypothetical protein [Chlamydiales bacterium]
MIFFALFLFALSVFIPIFAKREKQRIRVKEVFHDLARWEKELKSVEQYAGRSDLDDEKIEMARNRLSFAKNAFAVKMKR